MVSDRRKFTDRQRKIKMSLLVTKVGTAVLDPWWHLVRCNSWQVSQDEKLSTKQTVDEDRKHAVEASIVRVMKVSCNEISKLSINLYQ